MKDLGKKKRRLEELFSAVFEAEVQLRLDAIPKPEPERASDREMKLKHKLNMLRQHAREDAAWVRVAKDVWNEAMR